MDTLKPDIQDYEITTEIQAHLHLHKRGQSLKEFKI